MTSFTSQQYERSMTQRNFCSCFLFFTMECSGSVASYFNWNLSLRILDPCCQLCVPPTEFSLLCFEHCVIILSPNTRDGYVFSRVCLTTGTRSSYPKTSRHLDRCNVLKQPPVISWHRSIFNVTNLPYPWALRGEGLITSPLSLILEPSTHDHNLPFYLFPLNPLKYPLLYKYRNIKFE